MSCLCASDDQNTGASVSLISVNIQINMLTFTKIHLFVPSSLKTCLTQSPTNLRFPTTSAFLPLRQFLAIIHQQFCSLNFLNIHLLKNPSMGFPGGASGKEPACQCRNVRHAGLIPESGRFPGRGPGNPLQYSCPENPFGQRSLASYCP